MVEEQWWFDSLVGSTVCRAGGGQTAELSCGYQQWWNVVRSKAGVRTVFDGHGFCVVIVG